MNNRVSNTCISSSRFRGGRGGLLRITFLLGYLLFAQLLWQSEAAHSSIVGGYGSFSLVQSLSGYFLSQLQSQIMHQSQSHDTVNFEEHIQLQSSSSTNQFKPIPPSFSDDDFHPDEHNTTWGYVYFQYHSEAGCNGTVTAYSGIRTSICYTFDGAIVNGSSPDFQSYQIILYNETDCAQHCTIFYYTDAGCNDELFYSELTDNMYTCTNQDTINNSIALTYEASYELMCSFGDSIPSIDMPNVLTEYYLGDGNCSDTSLIVEFSSIITDVCLAVDVDSSASMRVTCTTDGDETVYTYSSTEMCEMDVNATASSSSFECELQETPSYSSTAARERERRRLHSISYKGNVSTELPTSLPTWSPTPLYGKSTCNNQPTPLPTEVPTLEPTEAPTEASSSVATLLPTFVPTFTPSLMPTVSIAPTFPQTYSPSQTQSPSVSMAPTISISPSVPPTLPPTLSPTFLPTANTGAPTVLPTSGVTAVKFSVEQVLNGISLNSYNQEQTTNMYVIKKSIASCMTNVSVDDIISFQVTAVTSRRRQLTQSVSASASTDAINLIYTISVKFAGASYNTLSSQLQTNVATGVFNTYLAKYSSAFGATDLTGCSSSTVATSELSTSSSGGDTVMSSLPAIIGIAVGGAVLLCCIVALIVWCMRRRKGGANYLGDSDSLSNRARGSGGSRKAKFSELRSYDKYLQQEDEESVTFGLAHHMAI